MTDDIERAFEIYIKERFPSQAAFEQACQDKNPFAIDWLVALPPGKRELGLAKAAKACSMGPCSLVRFSDDRTYIVAQPLVKKLLKDSRAEVLAVYQGTDL